MMPNSSASQFSPGSNVRVKKKDEILKTLDPLNKREGCLFMGQMWEYCGREFKVSKRINSFFDEYQHQMLKTRVPLYILEGLICEGTTAAFNFQCDRSCYLFWHEEWLEKIDCNKNGYHHKIINNSIVDISQRSFNENSGSQLYCQLTNIRDLARNNSILDMIIQSTAKILGFIKNRTIVLVKVVLEILIPTEKKADEQNNDYTELQRGDLVRVKSVREINCILDKHGKYKGCSFAREMYKYCGKEYAVLKPVAYFYDEAKKRNCKSKNIVILENATCSGEFKLFPMRCDRMCFFFWREEWLEKIEKGRS